MPTPDSKRDRTKRGISFCKTLGDTQRKKPGRAAGLSVFGGRRRREAASLHFDKWRLAIWAPIALKTAFSWPASCTSKYMLGFEAQLCNSDALPLMTRIE